MRIVEGMAKVGCSGCVLLRSAQKPASMGRGPLLLPLLPEALPLALAVHVTVVVAASPSWAGSQDRHGPLPAQVQPLVRELQAYGFQIRLAPPPKRGAYGLFESKSRTLWIAPVTIPLGIARQTFLHEAVHAIQSCPSGQLTPLGVTGPLNPVVEREISAILLRNYHHTNRLLEREAFLMQAQPDAVPRLQALLKQRCRTPSS